MSGLLRRLFRCTMSSCLSTSFAITSQSSSNSLDQTIVNKHLCPPVTSKFLPIGTVEKTLHLSSIDSISLCQIPQPRPHEHHRSASTSTSLTSNLSLFLLLPEQRSKILGQKPNPSNLHTNLIHLKQCSHTPPRRHPHAAPNQRAPVLCIGLHFKPRPPTRPSPPAHSPPMRGTHLIR
jgi:hypothetical protein